MSIADHRSALSEALDPAIGMTALRSKGRMVQHIGLWGLWWGSDGVSPDGMKVILATVHTMLTDAPHPPNRTTLGDLPWVVLQLQSLTPSDPIWDAATAALKDDIVAHGNHEKGAGLRCPGRITYDPSQDVHNFRKVAQPDVLQGYTIERIDGPTDVVPAVTLTRTRIPYTVFRGAVNDLRPQPLRIFMERPLPRKQQVGQRLQTESGFARRSDLMSAVGEWRTWILLDESAVPAP